MYLHVKRRHSALLINWWLLFYVNTDKCVAPDFDNLFRLHSSILFHGLVNHRQKWRSGSFHNISSPYLHTSSSLHLHRHFTWLNCSFNYTYIILENYIAIHNMYKYKANACKLNFLSSLSLVSILHIQYFFVLLMSKSKFLSGRLYIFFTLYLSP